MTITEMNLTPAMRESDWILNVIETDASAGIDLRAAIPDYRYGIKSITIFSDTTDKWIKILDGSDNLIGPIGAPYEIRFQSAVYGTSGNALVLKTQEAFGVHLIVQGTTGPPIPSKPFNPSPADEATGVSTSATLTWESIFQSVDYKVYFGTASDPLLVSEQSELTYDPSLVATTTYYWRIDETLGGNEVRGDVWTFST